MAVSLDSRRKVGRTTLEIPVCGLGTAHLGELYGRVDEDVSRATLQTAWDSGIRFFDTAPWYGRGLAERGCPKVQLQIRRGNLDVVAFYRALGYAEDEVISMGKRLEFDDEV